MSIGINDTSTVETWYEMEYSRRSQDDWFRYPGTHDSPESALQRRKEYEDDSVDFDYRIVKVTVRRDVFRAPKYSEYSVQSQEGEREWQTLLDGATEVEAHLRYLQLIAQQCAVGFRATHLDQKRCRIESRDGATAGGYRIIRKGEQPK